MTRLSMWAPGWRGFLILAFALGALLSTLPASAVWAQDPAHDAELALARVDSDDVEPVLSTDMPPTNCRYGTYATHSDWLDDLGVGWLISFNVNFPSWMPGNIEYAPMLRLRQKRDENSGERLWAYSIRGPQLNDSPGQLGDLLNRYPGRLWIVGNEVDRIYWQDDLMPDVYAMAYHDIYHFIKQRDPTAQVAIAGLVQVTPGRLQYLDIVWDSYRALYGGAMPVDVWTFHVYIFPEINADGTTSNASVALGTNPELALLSSGGDPALCPLEDVYCVAEHDDIDIFAEQVVAMRRWMKDHGQQNKPLVLSEFSLLYPFNGGCNFKDEYGNCFDPERVTAFMVKSVKYLETAIDPDLGYPLDGNRLVQQWLWFAAGSTTPDMPSKLIESDNSKLTLMGSTFRALVDSVALDNDLLVEKVSSPVVRSGAANTATATITADIRNGGNSLAAKPFTVALYADAGLTQLIDTATVPAGLRGCARAVHEVTIDWPNLPSGLHRFWIRVDDTEQIAERTEQNNVQSGLIYVDGYDIYLPISVR